MPPATNSSSAGCATTSRRAAAWWSWTRRTRLRTWTRGHAVRHWWRTGGAEDGNGLLKLKMYKIVKNGEMYVLEAQIFSGMILDSRICS